MNKLIFTIVVIILFASCSSKTKYTLIVTVEDMNEAGEKERKEIIDTIRQTCDSLAYFNGSAAFLVYRNTFALNSYKMSMSKPVDFKVFNEKGIDLRQVLNKSAVHFIDEYYEEHYIRAKPLIEKRKKKMLERE
ncbi:MAG: hypothetical protein ABIN89_23395 [Chitinophagaceae bacterium]